MSKFVIVGRSLCETFLKRDPLSTVPERNVAINDDAQSQPHRGEEQDGILVNVNDDHGSCLSQVIITRSHTAFREVGMERNGKLNINNRKGDGVGS